MGIKKAALFQLVVYTGIVKICWSVKSVICWSTSHGPVMKKLVRCQNRSSQTILGAKTGPPLRISVSFVKMQILSMQSKVAS